MSPRKLKPTLPTMKTRTHNDLINEIVAIDYEILDVKLEGLVRDYIRQNYLPVSVDILLRDGSVDNLKPFFWRDYVKNN